MNTTTPVKVRMKTDFTIEQNFICRSSSSSLSIVFVNVDMDDMDQIILVLAICNSSIGVFSFIFPILSEKGLPLSASGSFAVNKACHLFQFVFP